jgi:hypothetical protein
LSTNNSTFDGSDTFLTAFSSGALTPLPASAVYSVTQSVVLPNNSVGNSFILVVADGAQQQRESDESNNVAAASLTVDAPDLRVANLAITPPSLSSGTDMLIQWNDTNSGVGAARRSWYDRVLIENTTLGLTLLNTTLFYDADREWSVTEQPNDSATALVPPAGRHKRSRNYPRNDPH